MSCLFKTIGNLHMEERGSSINLCTLTLLSKIDLDYKQRSAPYPDNYISIKIMFSVSSNGALIGGM